MSNARYENAPKTITRLTKQMIKDHFPAMQNFNTKTVLDNKGMKSKGKRVLGKLKKVDDLSKFLTKTEENAFEGYTFVMILDKLMTETISKSDLKRVIFHELNHGGMDDKGNPIIIDHDFVGFYSELDYNKDDPKWSERIALQLAQAYGEE